MTRVGLVAKPDAAQAQAVILRLLDWFGGRDVTVVVEKETAGLVPAAAVATARKNDLPGQVDLVVVLGGDGTLLSMARAIGDLGVPILGVNLGGLGFLTATTLDEMLPALETLLAGGMEIEERMMLDARLVRGGQLLGEYVALNDVVITKSAMSRIIDLSVSVGGRHAISYRADGLIISTPTGSTAYNLSAGGPVVLPTQHLIITTPISPHTLAIRPLVVPPDSEVTVRAEDGPEELLVTIDGQVGTMFAPGDSLIVRRAAASVVVVRFSETTFFSVLRRKLGWGGLRERDEGE